MKIKFFSTLMLSAVALGLTANNPQNFNGKVNLGESTIAWTGYKVTGKHNGLVNLKSASLNFEGNMLKGGSFEIDMNTISCLDMTGEYATKLVNHLKSDDFFGVAAHPTVKFVTTKVIHQGQDLYKIEGNLTIKGVTKPIRFNSKVKDMDGIKQLSAQIKLDRADFNVKYGSGSFFDNLGDKTIYDEFDINVTLVTAK
ncbi:MAG: YceI family protein [Saprospiraceae bacterium]|nr:YceI family protein [Saprospiraceae bacterium]